MMVVLQKACKVWVFPQQLLCALLNLQVVPSLLQQILCWIMFLGAPMLLLSGLLVFRWLLYSPVSLLTWGEGALALMFLLVSLQSLSLFLLVRFSPFQEDIEDVIYQQETYPIAAPPLQRKAQPPIRWQEGPKKPGAAKRPGHLSQVLSPLARQIARAEDLAKIEQKIPPEVHRTRPVPIDHIPTMLLNLPKSPVYAQALKNKHKQISRPMSSHPNDTKG